MLTCVSHGMAPSSATCIGSTLRKARYYLRTAINESTSYWTNTPNTPIYGTGQGSGISPGICCATFSDLFDIHADISHGANYRSPIHNNSTTIHNIGYVDDTTTTVNDHHVSLPFNISQLSTMIQHDLQNWSTLLYISGGALEFSKTELFLMSWNFNEQGLPYLEDTSMSTISLQCPSTGNQHTISASSPLSSYKLLGFHLSPSQALHKQYKVLLERAHHIAYTISGSTVTRREAFLTYFSIFLPAVTYVLPLTHFSKKQCHKIQSKPTQIFLQKSGFPSTLCRDVVFGCRRSGGLGFRDLYVEQGVFHIIKFVQTLRTPGHSQKLLLLTIDEWQISSGFSSPLFFNTTKPCKHLEGSWLTSTREFLATLSGSIVLPHAYCPSPLRILDQPIMEAFNKVPGLGRKRLMQLNCCRIFLQIHFLSEITNSSGDTLIPGFWSGDTILRPAPPIHRYPRQAPPSPALWQLWRATIRKCFCTPCTTSLRTHLGPWLFTSYRRFPSITCYPLRLWHSPTHYSSYCKTTYHPAITPSSSPLMFSIQPSPPLPSTHVVLIFLRHLQLYHHLLLLSFLPLFPHGNLICCPTYSSTYL